MVRKGLNLLFIFLLFFAFSFSQKVITNRTLKKYHHSSKKKSKVKSQEKSNKYKNKKVAKPDRSLEEKRAELFKETKDMGDLHLENRIVENMDKYWYLNDKYLKEYSKLNKIRQEILKNKVNGGSVPSYLKEKFEREKEKLDSILEQKNVLEDQIARDLKKADEKGLLKDKKVLEDFKTNEEKKKEELKEMELK